MLDVVAGKWRTDQLVAIEDDRIIGVFPSQRTRESNDGAQVLDGRGKYVIPGLIDAHVHLVHRIDYGHATGDEILPMFLAAGVTGLRDTGDEIIAETVVAHFADSHPEYCPRVFRCSGLLDGPTAIHRDVGIPIADPEQVPAIVKNMADWGVTTLKIYAGSRRPVGRRIIEEGHKHGKVVTAHLSQYSAQDAVEDGVDCLEHITSVFDFILPEGKGSYRDKKINADFNSPKAKQLIQMLVEKKVMVNPTLVVYRNMLLLSDMSEYNAHPDNARVPQRIKDHWDAYRETQRHQPATRKDRQREFQRYMDLVGVMHKAGVMLLIGTDTAEPYCPPGYSLHQEMEMYAQIGMSPAEILRCATINNARAVRREKDLGTIEVGKIADLVLLEADPLKEIGNARKVWRVIRSGYVSDPETLLRKIPIQ